MKTTTKKPAKREFRVYLTRAQAAAPLSSVDMALRANGGDCPDTVREALLAAVETLNEEFGFGL